MSSSKVVKDKFRFVRRAVFFAAYVALLSGCATVDLFSWNNAERSKDALISAVGSLDKNSVFNFVLDNNAESMKASLNFQDAFPVQAPGIKLPSPRLEVNHEVRRELANYLRNNARCIGDGLSRQSELFPVLAKILNDEGLPEELLNLALIESGFKAEVRSPAGAVGLWQFMPGTAKIYGLEVSRKIDERRDPILSTIAAARHLKELYAKYNDWYLVLAAYNAGGGIVDRATYEGKRPDYWNMVRTKKLSGETARFVPKFIAASILQKLYSRYGNEVQLAQYLDRHIVVVGDNGAKQKFAFSLETEASRG